LKHVGETVTVEGKIINKQDLTSYGMNIMVLGMGKSSSETGSFGFEIKTSDLSKFPTDLYVGKTIRVTGTVKLNISNGPSMDLSDPSQVEVVG
jgi:hypothetical protein